MCVFFTLVLVRTGRCVCVGGSQAQPPSNTALYGQYNAWQMYMLETGSLSLTFVLYII